MNQRISADRVSVGVHFLGNVTHFIKSRGFERDVDTFIANFRKIYWLGSFQWILAQFGCKFTDI